MADVTGRARIKQLAKPSLKLAGGKTHQHCQFRYGALHFQVGGNRQACTAEVAHHPHNARHIAAHIKQRFFDHLKPGRRPFAACHRMYQIDQWLPCLHYATIFPAIRFGLIAGMYVKVRFADQRFA